MSQNPGPIDPEALRLLEELVRLDTTNLEDPASGKLEKRHYSEGAELVARRAREWGLEARIWDAREKLPDGGRRFREPRPNVVVDLPGDGEERLLLVSHFDVVPVPEEQLQRWKSPPHELVRREGGRYYGRGAADDLGSGVVSGLLAMRRLAREGGRRPGVRMVVCCDEETGGAGGIEALREHDGKLPMRSLERILSGKMTLIPDGSPHVAAGSSGVSFVDVSLEAGTTVTSYLRIAEALTRFHEVANSWVSALPSPPEPSGHPPNPFITGRATLTLSDVVSGPGGTEKAHLSRWHSNSDAANQIPASVSLQFAGPQKALESLSSYLTHAVPQPFHATSRLEAGRLSLEIAGKSGHGGYPHRAFNPVPRTTQALLDALAAGVLGDSALRSGSMTLDLRSPPEMEVTEALAIFTNYFERLRSEVPGAHAVVPPGRERSGYFMKPTDPRVVELEHLFDSVSGRKVGTYGEYGGTDASALRYLTTPTGEPMPVVVVGAMDDEAHIHDAEESLEPRLFHEVVELIVRWVKASGGPAR